MDCNRIAGTEAVTRLGLGGSGLEMNKPPLEEHLGMVAGALQNGGEEDVEAFAGMGAHFVIAENDDGCHRIF